MKIDKTTTKRLMFLIVFAAVVTAVVRNLDKAVAAAGYVLGLLFPLVLGGAIAFVLNVPLCFIERHMFKKDGKIASKLKRPVSITLSVLIVAAVIAAVLLLVIPELVKTVRVLIRLAPDFSQKLKLRAEEIYNRYPEIQSWADSALANKKAVSDTVMEIINKSAGGLLGSTFSMIGSFFGGVVNTVVGAIFAIYILANKEKLGSQFSRLFKAWLPRKHCEKLFYVCYTANGIFRKFVVGQLTEALILGVLCMLGMILFRFPYAAMVGALVGITALIPIVGALIGAGVGAFMIMMQDPVKALFFILFIIILQQIEGNLIYPKVVGSSVGLPPMWVLAAVTVGGGFMGIVGMLISVPVASTIYAVVKDNVGKCESKKARRTESDQAVTVVSHREETVSEASVGEAGEDKS